MLKWSLLGFLLCELVSGIVLARAALKVYRDE
jgi:hypothetical protein